MIRKISVHQISSDISQGYSVFDETQKFPERQWRRGSCLVTPRSALGGLDTQEVLECAARVLGPLGPCV